jgi:hypothetical protein
MRDQVRIAFSPQATGIREWGRYVGEEGTGSGMRCLASWVFFSLSVH